MPSLILAALIAAIDLHALAAWCSAHPYEAVMGLGVVLNVLNGLLPATIRTGPVGTALHVLLDRVTILTRRNAPGTLKWPIIAGSILRAVADSLNPPEAPVPVAAAPTRADEFDLRATVAPPPPAIAPSPSTLRAPTLTGVAAIDEEAVFQAERKHVARALGFDASARQAIPGEAVAAARALTDEAGE